MRSDLRRCTKCGRYGLDDTCSACSSPNSTPVPMRFSPDDRYGEYRRISMQENGKHVKFDKV